MSTVHSETPSGLPIGAVLPQNELPTDPDAIRDYLIHLDREGYASVMAYDHVLGADTATRPGWSGSYDADDPFLEVLTAFAWAAAFTESLISSAAIVGRSAMRRANSSVLSSSSARGKIFDTMPSR